MFFSSADPGKELFGKQSIRQVRVYGFSWSAPKGHLYDPKSLKAVGRKLPKLANLMDCSCKVPIQKWGLCLWGSAPPIFLRGRLQKIGSQIAVSYEREVSRRGAESTYILTPHFLPRETQEISTLPHPSSERSQANWLVPFLDLLGKAPWG